MQIGASLMRRDEDEFRPRLGRIRGGGNRTSKRFAARLAAAAEKAAPGAFARRSGRAFSGARIGQGSGAGAGLAMRGANAASRRVAVKIRSVRMGGGGLAKARAHLNYIRREGAEREGGPGRLYGRDRDDVDGTAFLEEGRDDRHQFRIILAPEDGTELDLSRFTRDVMTAAEQDLCTRLDWVAVNHFDTGHPHAHVVLRGRTEEGEDLVIARNYITNGFRRRAEEVATLELGPRRAIDVARARRAEIDREAFTSLDLELLRRVERGHVRLDAPQTARGRSERQLLLGRLKTLETMRLAEKTRGGWRLKPHLETTLRAAGRRGDIIRSMGAALGVDFAPARFRDFAEAPAGSKIFGRVVGAGASGEEHERRFLVLDGADDGQWRVAIDLPLGATPQRGAIVEASRGRAEQRPADRTIAEIAARHGGRYSDALHAAADPSATADYRLTHKRRLEALRRVGVVEREREGGWRIPPDILAKAAAVGDARNAVRLDVLSWVPLETLIDARAETLLDAVLDKRRAIAGGSRGLGRELDEALAARRRWLVAEGFGREGETGFFIDRARLRALGRASVVAAADRIARESRKAALRPASGDLIEGVYRGPIDMPAGRYAIIEGETSLSLVPWRAVIEQRRGREVSGLVRASGVAWSLEKVPGRER